MCGDFALEMLTKANGEGQNGGTESGCDKELCAPADDGIQQCPEA